MKKVIVLSLIACVLCSCAKETENVGSPSPTADTAVQATAEPTAEPTQTPVPKSAPTPTAAPTKAPEQTKSETSSNKKLSNLTICIDAGHGETSLKGKEKIAPNSDVTKAAHVSGTSGKDMSEQELNLLVAKKLQSKLAGMGVNVIMTRTTANCDKSNIERAEMANDANADLMIRIHADGIEDSSVSGMSMLVPTTEYIKDKDMVDKSVKIGETVLKAVVAQTGAKNRGISRRGDMTGFNWSKVPVILLEMGFMTNREEEKKLITDEYQDKIVDGVVNGLTAYYG